MSPTWCKVTGAAWTTNWRAASSLSEGKAHFKGLKNNA